ncbi:MAG: hypothetical protein ABIO67_12640 [Mycobacteriales bacterium]
MTSQRGRESSGRWWLALLSLPILCCAGTTLLGAIGVGSVPAAVGGLAGSALLAAAGIPILLIAAVLLVRRRVRG